MFVLNRRHVLGICDRHHRARLRPQHLGLHARRYDQGRHARQAAARPASTGWPSASRRRADRVRADVDKALRPGGGLPRQSSGSARPASTSSATTSSACPRTTSTRCRRRSTWRWISTASSPTSTPRWPIPARRSTTQAVAHGLPLPEHLDRLLAARRRLPAAADAAPPPREVLRFRDEAFHRYYTDPAYLAMVERRFGAATVADIRAMTSHRLVRSNADRADDSASRDRPSRAPAPRLRPLSPWERDRVRAPRWAGGRCRTSTIFESGPAAFAPTASAWPTAAARATSARP